MDLAWWSFGTVRRSLFRLLQVEECVVAGQCSLCGWKVWRCVDPPVLTWALRRQPANDGPQPLPSLPPGATSLQLHGSPCRFLLTRSSSYRPYRLLSCYRTRSPACSLPAAYSAQSAMHDLPVPLQQEQTFSHSIFLSLRPPLPSSSSRSISQSMRGMLCPPSSPAGVTDHFFQDHIHLMHPR